MLPIFQQVQVVLVNHSGVSDGTSERLLILKAHSRSIALSPPGSHRINDRPHFSTLLGERVLRAGRMRIVYAAFDNAMIFEHF